MKKLNRFGLLVGASAMCWTAGIFAAVQPKVIDPKSFKVEVKGEGKDFAVKTKVIQTANGKALYFEMPHVPYKGVTVLIPLGDVNMIDDLPTIDFTVEQTQKGRAKGSYKSAVGDMTEPRIGVATNFVTGSYTSRIHYEPAHEPHWASWTDARKMRRLDIFFPADTWDDAKAVQKITLSAVKLLPENKWKGTEQDKEYHKWLKFCDSYEADLSDSSKYLEPPVKGRLKKPIKLVKKANGKSVANCEIVVYPDTYKSVELAARELQHWIKEMTGVEVPIVTEASAGKMPRIHLNSPWAAKKWAKDVEWLKKGADVDGYFVHTVGNDIYIGCAVPSDTTHENAAERGLPRDACAVGVFRGAVAFLENNSTIIFVCPDEKYGTIYDKTDEFVVRWGDGRDRPNTCGRGWLAGTDFRNTRKIPLTGNEIWRARNKTNVRMAHRLSGHAAQAGEMIEYFPNTEAYQVWNGEKRLKFGYYAGQVCLGAEDALEQAFKKACAKIENCLSNNYPVTSIGFWNEDNWLVCICEKCTAPIKLADGTILTSNKTTAKDQMTESEKRYRSTQYMLFANRLADKIAAKYPGVKLELLAYFFQYPAPKCKVSKNIAWISAPYRNRSTYSVPLYHPLGHWPYRNTKEFLAAGGELRWYDYYSYGGNVTTSHWGPSIEAATEDYRYLTSLGGKLIGSEYAYVGDAKEPFAVMHGWLFTQAAWHADLKEVSDLRKYYIRRVFREGAPIVEKYVLEQLRAAFHSCRWWTDGPEILRGGEKVKAMFEPYLKQIKNETARYYFQSVMKKAIEAH